MGGGMARLALEYLQCTPHRRWAQGPRVDQRDRPTRFGPFRHTAAFAWHVARPQVRPSLPIARPQNGQVAVLVVIVHPD
jgi:hypothetical protein